MEAQWLLRIVEKKADKFDPECLGGPLRTTTTIPVPFMLVDYDKSATIVFHASEIVSIDTASSNMDMFLWKFYP